MSIDPILDQQYRPKVRKLLQRCVADLRHSVAQFLLQALWQNMCTLAQRRNLVTEAAVKLIKHDAEAQ
jgi:hypothetical protein